MKAALSFSTGMSFSQINYINICRINYIYMCCEYLSTYFIFNDLTFNIICLAMLSILFMGGTCEILCLYLWTSGIMMCIRLNNISPYHAGLKCQTLILVLLEGTEIKPRGQRSYVKDHSAQHRLWNNKF